MLSPADYHKTVPRHVYGDDGNMAFRAWLARRIRANKRTREQVVEHCSQDLLFYINTFAWTYNPKGDRTSRDFETGAPRVIPFVSYPFQDRAFRVVLNHIQRQRDLAVEKSREVGLSWLCDYCLEWLWHFVPWTESLLISRLWDLVDGKTPHALMWKIDFMHQWLPEWLMPKGYDPAKHRLKGYFENPLMGSTMTGQATTEKSGIGGRATVILFDEFSRIDNAEAIRDGTADVSDCRLFVSTHTGPGTAFHGLCTNGVTSKLTVHWTEHPVKSRGLYRYDEAKNLIEVLDKSYAYPVDYPFVRSSLPAGGPHPGLRSPWYDNECARRGSSRAIAMDLDIDVTGSQSGYFDQLLLNRLIAESKPPYWEGEVKYDRDTGEPVTLLEVEDGPVKLWCHVIRENDCFRPKRGHYAAGADVGTGGGATPSCLSIVDVKTGEKVLEYANAHVEPKEFARIAIALCKLFESPEGTPCRLIWEIPGPGLNFGKEVMELGFTHVYFRTAELPHTREIKVSERPGWASSPKENVLLLDDYRTALALRQFTNYSAKALEECKSFRYTKDGNGVEHADSANKDDPQKARSNHGDRVIADALAWKLARGKQKVVKQKESDEPPLLSLAWRRQLNQNKRREQEEWI